MSQGTLASRAGCGPTPASPDRLGPEIDGIASPKRIRLGPAAENLGVARGADESRALKVGTEPFIGRHARLGRKEDNACKVPLEQVAGRCIEPGEVAAPRLPAQQHGGRGVLTHVERNRTFRENV